MQTSDLKLDTLSILRDLSKIEDKSEPLGLTEDKRLVTLYDVFNSPETYLPPGESNEFFAFNAYANALSSRTIIPIDVTDITVNIAKQSLSQQAASLYQKDLSKQEATIHVINKVLTEQQDLSLTDLSEKIEKELENTDLYSSSSVAVGDKQFPIKIIGEDTPLLFQWFNIKGQGMTIPDLYISNIKKACTIEKHREVGLLTNGMHLSQENRDIFSKLCSEHPNLRLINFYDLDLGDMNFEVTPELINELERRGDAEFGNLAEITQAKGENLTIKEAVHLLKNASQIDTPRFMAMNLAGKLFSDNPSSSKSGCIFLDCDMELKQPIGELQSVDGFLCYRRKISEVYHSENGLMAVDKPGHPIMESILRELQISSTDSSRCTLNAFPFYLEAVEQHFSLLNIPESIGFPLDSINPDQSKTTEGSTWLNQ